MEPELALASLGGVASRTDLVAALGRHAFDNAVKRGLFVAVFPRAYAAVWDTDQHDVRVRAALISVGGDAALRHTSALRVRDLPDADADLIHITAYQTRHPRGVPDELVVHRTLRPLEPGLLANGCESPLEMWGYEHVFAVPGLDDAARQRTVHVGGKTYRLDLVFEHEMLNIELDGRRYHSSPEQWGRNTPSSTPHRGQHSGA